MLRRATLLLACSLLAATSAFAGSTTHEVTINLQSTNWMDDVVIPKHNTAEGCLDSVCVELEGYVEGSAAFESQDAAPATVTMDLSASIQLQRPDNSVLVTTIPVVQTSDNVTAFDGLIDFGGTSGRTYSDLNASKTESDCTSAPADLALFTGAGNITLPAKADGVSSGTGAGNLILQFSTSASAVARITYHWTECIVSVEESTWSAVKGLFD